VNVVTWSKIWQTMPVSCTNDWASSVKCHTMWLQFTGVAAGTVITIMGWDNTVIGFYRAMHLVHSAVLRSHVVCLSIHLSVCLSVTLVNCDHTGWNSSKIISPSVSLGRSLFATPTWRVCSKGNTPKFGPKVTPPLLIWASETFDRKLRPNGHR